MGNATWRFLSIGSTLAATKLATMAASKGWKVMTGRPVPIKGDFEHERTRDVVAYAALSSMLVVGARVAAERKAAQYYRQSTGHLPRGIARGDITLTDVHSYRKLRRARAKASRAVKHVTS